MFLINGADSHNNPLRRPAPESRPQPAPAPRPQPTPAPTTQPKLLSLSPPPRIHDPQVAPMAWQQAVTAEEPVDSTSVDPNPDFQPAETVEETAAPFMGAAPQP